MKTFLFPLLLAPLLLHAHFQIILPERDNITIDAPSMELEYLFTHPFEQTLMQMDMPNELGVFMEGKKENLKRNLVQKKRDGFDYYSLNYRFKAPGDYIFYVDPKPYFEAAEGKFIRHITKTTVDAFGAEEGWDRELGLKAEIVPLVRPYSLYAGNIFQGQILYKGKIVPHAEIEVELYNDKGYSAPTNSHITQVIKADANGVFSYAMPKSGWWGFAALLEDDVQLTHTDDKRYPVELGAVMWVYAHTLD